MPIYTARCNQCNQVHEYVRSVGNYLDTPVCCSLKTEKVVLYAPSVRCDIAPWESYISPSSGKLVTSHSERREDMKSTGCRDWEGLEVEKRIASQNKQYIEKEEDAKIEAAAVDVWRNMDQKKKDTLLAGA